MLPNDQCLTEEIFKKNSLRQMNMVIQQKLIERSIILSKRKVIVINAYIKGKEISIKQLYFTSERIRKGRTH